MTKKSGNAYTGTKVAIAAQRRIMAQARNRGFRYTNVVNDAIFGNLSTTERGLARKLTAGQAKTVAKLQAMQRRAKTVGARSVSTAKSTVANRYGSVIEGGTDFSGVKAQGKAGLALSMGNARAGKAVARGAGEALGIAKAGAAQARAGADYATAQALAYRAKNDAGITAAAQLELQKLRLQNRLDIENYKKKARIQQRLDAKNGMTGRTQVGQTAQDMGTWMRQWFAEHPQNEAGDPSTAMDAYNAYTTSFPVTDEAAGQLASTIATTVYGSINHETGQTMANYDTRDEANDLTNAILTLYPHYGENGDIEGTLYSGLVAYWDALTIDQNTPEDTSQNVDNPRDPNGSGRGGHYDPAPPPEVTYDYGSVPPGVNPRGR